MHFGGWVFPNCAVTCCSPSLHLPAPLAVSLPPSLFPFFLPIYLHRRQHNLSLACFPICVPACSLRSPWVVNPARAKTLHIIFSRSWLLHTVNSTKMCWRINQMMAASCSQSIHPSASCSQIPFSFSPRPTRKKIKPLRLRGRSVIT